MISNLLCHVCQENGEWVWLPLEQSPYYLSLKNKSSVPFNKYHKLLKKYTSTQNYANEISYEQFLELLEDIRINGIKEDVTVKDNKIYDGQHRLSIVKYLSEEK